VLAIAALMMRSLVRRGRVWSALVVLPALWVAVEWLRYRTTPHGTAGSLAYTQLKFLPFLQLASITGPWGMTFFLLLFESAIAIAIYLWQRDRRRAIRVFSAGCAATALVLLYGAVRLTLPEGKTMRVGLIASDVRENLVPTEEGKATERLYRDYAAAADRLAADGAEAIVMPEKLGVIVDPDTRPMDRELQMLADRTGAVIVAGVVRVSTPLKYNEARTYVPNVEIASYDKEHMLPPFESDLEPGKALTLVSRSHQTLGVAICKDMDFPRPARSYGEAGAAVLLVPAWDFVVDNLWHGHIAVMRGVEDGFSVVRAAKGGYLTVSDWRGKIVAEQRSDASTFATLLADVPAEHHSTLYQRLGDWFAWLAIGILVFAAARLVLP